MDSIIILDNKIEDLKKKLKQKLEHYDNRIKAVEDAINDVDESIDRLSELLTI